VAGVLLTLFTPAVANAAGTAQFTVSPSQGRPGDPIQLTSVDSCPPIPPGQPGDMPFQDAVLTFIDSAGVSSGDQVVTGTGSDGTWDSETFFPFPHFLPPVFDPSKFTNEPAVGMGSLHMRCVMPDGSTSLEYAPQPFNVTGAAYRMTGPATPVQPGGVVHISSVDPCPGNRVGVSLMGAPSTVNFDATPDANGMWTADIPAAVQEMDGSLTPFQPGVYGMGAYCMTEATAKIHFGYAAGTFTVGSPTPPACDDVLFIAAAGSGQHYTSDTNLAVSPELKKVYDGLREVIPSNKKVGVQVLNYPALSVDVLFEKADGVNLRSAKAVLGHNIPRYLDGKNAGVTALYEAVGHAHFTCPNQALVLAGFSQGGMVVHQFLQEYAQTSGTDKLAIKAAVLVADPMRVANSQVFDFGTASSSSYGICRFVSAVVNCNGLVAVQDIPAMYRPLTTSICEAYDAVCDTSSLASTLWPLGFRAASEVGTRVHGTYSITPTVKTAGKRAARQVMKGF
jgi:hypothetical protein